jgi:molybdopterin/thiamine biosynthesis adenylyltransferase/rhodanese-related sulfurtransferase
MLSTEELLRYNRQILVPELGLDGQQCLKRGSVLVIGAGGLGSPALLYLAAAGIGRIGVLDFDKVDVSNLQRQVLYAASDAGSPKAIKASERIRLLNPLIQVETHYVALDRTNALDIISRYDVIIDGSDNLPTRYLVNDACLLMNKTLIYGAIFQFEGHVSVFNQEMADGTRGPNYRDLFPEPPPPEMVPACGVSGVIGTLPGIIGSMQAHEAIKVLTKIGNTLSGRLMIFDGLDFTTHFLNIKHNEKNAPVTHLIDYDLFCNPADPNHINEITAEGLKLLIDGKAAIQLVDVREPFEFDLVNIGGINIPVNALADGVTLIDKGVPVILLCKSGQRSHLAAQRLTEMGFTNVRNMKGGLIAWKNEVDRAIQLY